MIGNIFLKRSNDIKEKKKEQIKLYDEDIRKSEELSTMLQSTGYEIMKGVIDDLRREYETEAYKPEQTFDIGKILMAKASALREFEEALNDVLSEGKQSLRIQNEIIESL